MDSATIGFRALIFFLVLLFVITPLEALFPLRREQAFFRSGWCRDFAFFFINPLIVNISIALLLSLFGSFAELGISRILRKEVSSLPWTLQIIVVLGFSEVALYWMHRLSHRVPFLWKLHAVHHSAEELDWLAAHRQHPLELILLLGAANLPSFILGFSLSAITTLVVSQKIYTAFLHSNCNVSFGRFNGVFASPVFHHWHHSADRKDFNKNFASFFPFIDRAFGTFHLPPGAPERYGLK
jgi:sterol desaturase/sphingolipid hydroxylase (fatty acid hydroxylase superfamily)